MEKEKRKQSSIIQRLKRDYLSQLIQIHEDQQTSVIFAVTIEILRFVFGHSMIYCAFMTKTFDNTINGTLFSGIRDVFHTNIHSIEEQLQLISVSLLILMLLYITLFCLAEKLQHKFSISKILNLTGNYVKVTSQFFSCLLGLLFYTSTKSQNYLMMLLAIIQMLIILVVFKLGAIYQHKNKFQTEDLYVHNENLTVEINNFVFCVISFLAPMMMVFWVPDFIRIVIVLAWMGLQAVRMNTTVIHPYYQNDYVHKIYASFTCIQTAQLAVQTFNDFVVLSMLNNNVISAILAISLFLIWGVLNYRQFLTQKSFFLTVEDIKSNNEVFLLVNSYYNALQQLQKSSDLSMVCLIVSSIRKNHQNKCKNLQCYCHKGNNVREFLKSYLYEMLLKLEITFSHNSMVMLYIYSFKFHVYHHYVKTYQQIQNLEKIKQLSFFQTLLSMQLKHKLRQWIDCKNKQFKVISVCLAIRLQEDMVTINEIILNDIEVKFKKWNNFAKELSRIEEVRSMSNKEIENLVKIENIKSTKWERYSRSHTFNAVLYFYFKKVLLKSSDLADLEENIRDLNRKIKEEEFGKQSLFSKYLFHRNACTVECSIRANNFGMILNTSKSVFDVFGYTYRRILGQNISCLFPNFLVKQKNISLKQWAEHGDEIQTLARASEDYCQHKQNYSFIVHRYMKVYTGFEHITLNIAFFKKNDHDLILIDNEGKLQSYGKSIKAILKHAPNKIQCDYVFKEMKNILLNADEEDKIDRTIVFNEKITNQLLNGSRKITSCTSKVSSNVESLKKSKKQFSKDSNTNFNTSNQKIQKADQYNTHQDQDASVYEDVWGMTFAYKKVIMGTQVFYKIEAKGLIYVKSLNDTRKQDDLRQIRSDIGSDMMTNTQKMVQNGCKEAQVGQQENSSMASFSSQLGYGISKLISRFSFIMLNPSKLNDKRMKRKLFFDIIFTLILITILCTTLTINKFSLQEKTSSMKAKGSIDKVLNLMQASINHVFNIFMYKGDLNLQRLAIDELLWDSQKFMDELDNHLKQINQEITYLQGQVLYDYLKSPMNVTFKNIGVKEVSLLKFFKIFLYLFTQIRQQITSATPNITSIQESYNLLFLNVDQLRLIRNKIALITKTNLENNDEFNRNYLIITLVLFFFVSGVYSFYLNHYKEFRFRQIENHVMMYQMIPHEILKNLTEYYYSYYKHFVIEKKKIDACIDSEEPIFQQQLQENYQSQQLTSSNKVKFIGKGKYWIWIGILFIFALINGGNIGISYNMYEFNKEVQFFANLSSRISSSESLIFTRWIRLKAQYYFVREGVTTQYLNFLLSFINQVQVDFNTYTTFQQNWITQSDGLFRQQFNHLLTTSPCILNEANMTNYQLKVCNEQCQISKNGVISFVNSLSRNLRNILLKWKSNLTQIVQSQQDALRTQKQFKEVDFAISFHGPTFVKINEKLSSVYQNGFHTQFKTYITISICMVISILLNLVWNMYNLFQEKVNLSYLYGYTLLFPPSTLKHSKYLLKFIRTNLQFSEKN